MDGLLKLRHLIPGIPLNDFGKFSVASSTAITDSLYPPHEMSIDSRYWVAGGRAHARPQFTGLGAR